MRHYGGAVACAEGGSLMKQLFDRWARRWSPKVLSNVAATTLITLIFLNLYWELWFAPLHEGGSWLVLKAVLLLFPLRGILAERRYTYQWASMFILLFFGEGVVRAFSDLSVDSRFMAWIEMVLSVIFFCSVVLFARAVRLHERDRLMNTHEEPVTHSK